MNAKIENIQELGNNFVACKGKLVLIKCDPKEAMLHGFAKPSPINFNVVKLTPYNYKNGGLIRGMGDYLKPIIISETEEIEKGDWFWYHQEGYKKQPIVQAKNGINIHGGETHNKILALPENISPEILKLITDGKLKDGDEVMLECEQMSAIDIDGKEEIKEDVVLVSLGLLELIKYSFYQIKLSNNFVSLFFNPLKGFHDVNEFYEQKTEETWAEIFTNYLDSDYVHYTRIPQEFRKWLIENYNPPTKKC